jgi:hypothetical protein
MKIRTALAVVVLLAWGSVGKAGIISDFSADADNDGVITCNSELSDIVTVHGVLPLS